MDIKKGLSAVSARSKKVVISLIFMISVICDTVWLKDVVYGDDLFTSKVFWAFTISICVIAVKDFQGIITKIVKGKFNIED
jgi:hypothetical protein